MAHLPHRIHWVLEGKGVGDGTILDGGEYQRCRAELHKHLDFGQIGVADDHMQAAILGRVSMRLVPRVDDRPLQRRFEANLFFEEVGTLGELEVDRRPTVLGTDLARPGEGLTSDEEGREVLDYVR